MQKKSIERSEILSEMTVLLYYFNKFMIGCLDTNSFYFMVMLNAKHILVSVSRLF